MSLQRHASWIFLAAVASAWLASCDRRRAEPSTPAAPPASGVGLIVTGGDPEDQGVVPIGATITRRLRLTNQGAVPLHLSVGHVSCSCLQPVIERPTLQPGETTEVRLEAVVAESLRELTQSMEIRTSVAGTTDFTQRYVATIRYTPDVQVVAVPPVIWGEYLTHERRPVEVRIRGTGGAPVRVLGATCDLTGSRVNDPVPGEENLVQLQVDTSVIGVQRGTLRIQTSRPGKPDLEVPISIRVHATTPPTSPPIEAASTGPSARPEIIDHGPLIDRPSPIVDAIGTEFLADHPGAFTLLTIVDPSCSSCKDVIQGTQGLADALDAIGVEVWFVSTGLGEGPLPFPRDRFHTLPPTRRWILTGPEWVLIREDRTVARWKSLPSREQIEQAMHR